MSPPLTIPTHRNMDDATIPRSFSFGDLPPTSPPHLTGNNIVLDYINYFPGARCTFVFESIIMSVLETLTSLRKCGCGQSLSFQMNGVALKNLVVPPYAT